MGEIKLTLAPVVHGAGLRLFDGPLDESRWNLASAVPYKNGFVELSYTTSGFVSYTKLS